MPTTHPEDGALLALGHGEGSDRERATVRAHLDSCSTCRERSDRLLDERMFDQLRLLDAPVPPITASAVIARAQRGGSGHFWTRAAAGVLLVVGVGGVAYAIPGSPIRRMVERLTARRMTTAPAAPTAAPAPVPQAAPPMAGVAVAPGASYVVRLEGPSVGGGVFVTVTDEATLTARATAGTARFSSDEKRLVIRWSDTTAAVTIGIPRTAPRVAVTSGEVRLFVKEGDRITTAASADASGRYRLVLRP